MIMGAIEDAVHKLIDVAAGRRNLLGAEADAEHDAISPGYNDVPVTAEAAAAAQAIVDKAAAQAAAAAAAAPAAAADPVAPAV